MAQGHYELRIDLTDWQDNRAYAQYNLFEIGHAKDKYELFVTGYSWDAGVVVLFFFSEMSSSIAVKPFSRSKAD